MTIFLIGFMGSGKSYLGKILSQKMGIPLIDLDEWIEKKYGRSISSIFSLEGEEAFRKMETAALDELNQLSIAGKPLLVSTGGGTPCFNGNMEWMNQTGITVWLNPPIETLLSRLSGEKEHRPLVASLSQDELNDFVKQKIKDRTPFYNQAKLKVDQAAIDVESLIKQIQHASDLQ
ncbi:MAG: shikimate kinase [Chitinophagia bacterium]|nr:shikimate kinase [Chitinophagia bacterium]